MTNKTVRQKRDAIHENIRNAAIREFARDGLSGTSTQAIARAAGITKAQLHYYISSKDDLYQQVLGQIISQWKDIFFLSAALPDDPRAVISDYVYRKIRHALEFPDAARVFSHEVARGAPQLAPYWPEMRRATEEAAKVIQGWIDRGKIRPVDPLLFQMNLWAVTQHYADYETQARVMLGTPPDAPLDEARIATEAVALFLGRCGLLDDERTIR
ncbi:MAG: TetR/AcrR family transcriptional regulator [Pseudorhodobacter sp.]